MSPLARLNKATEFLSEKQVEVGQPPTNGNVHKVSFHANSSYPLATDPTLGAMGEHFDVLRTRLLRAHSETGLHSVIVTSPQRGEGKSLVCANLAISFGRLSKHRLLLVDGDLRCKGLTRLMDLEGAVGVSEFLRGDLAFKECICPTDYASVWVTATGKSQGDSVATLLEGPRWAEFLTEAKQTFDLIVVDSVPIAAPIADFELLSRVCDRAILVVHLRKTTHEAMETSVQRLNNKLLGVVVNNTEGHLGEDQYYYSQAQ